MESRLKLKISRMFGSCRNRNVSSDVIENPFFSTENRGGFQKIEPFSPKVRPFPSSSMCKPRLAESMKVLKEKEFVYDDVCRRRRKVTDRGVCFVTGGGETEGRSCPPASPCSPSNLISQFQGLEIKEKKKKPMKKPMKKSKRRDCIRLSSSSSNDGWFSSEKEEEEEEEETEDETETFFSSKSFSSDSSESHRRYKKNSRRKLVEARRKKALNKQKSSTASSNMGGGGGGGLCCSCMKKGKVEDSFAIVKRSSDPHSDFRTSMVEMIIEKQIFQAKDLEKLLQCFLSLNSSHHHRVIVEVFTEIWDALFSNWS